MRVRALDINGDWTFGKGQNNFKVDLDALEQSIQTRVMMFLGDCFFATDQGIDWYGLLGGKNTVEVALQVSATIMNTSGVTAITQLDMNLDEDTRDLTITYSVDTIFGNIEESPILLPGNFLVTESDDIITTEDGGGITP